jgi:tRNA A-37 threonylcarbamoyl transferase component Bud32
MTLTTGQVLQNRYRIVSPLAQGGMGAIYRAWDTRLSVPVALKEMTPQPGLDPHMLAQLRQQFQQEAVVLARLDHPHLVAVSDFFEEGGNAYLVMKFIEGESLAERIERQGALPEREVLAWGNQLLDALAYCHSQGVIHRDVKPQNVIIRPDERAVLVDFGLVKLWDPSDPRTKTAMRGMGTPEYAPPEQYDAQMGHTDPRSDIYSLGATLYHALTGQTPPTATQRIASRNAFQPPRTLNQNISPATEAVILQAMELTVEDRLPTAQDMAAALSSGAPAPARPAVVPKRQPTKVLPEARPAAPARRKRAPVWAWILGASAILALIICMATLFALRPASVKPMPGGAVLLTSDQDGKREIYQLTGEGEVIQVTYTPGNGEGWSPALTPEGSILFTSDQDGKQEIYQLTGEGEVVRVTYTPGDGESWSPASTPDGAILFTSNQDGKREIYQLTGEGEVMQVTYTPGNGESWSPISTPEGSVLFTSDQDGKREIYQLTGEGEVVRVTYTPGNGESWAPVSTPEGSILFTSDQDGKREIYQLTGEGEVTQVTYTPGSGECWLPAW